MRAANPLWGAPRLHGELRTLGIKIAQATVAQYLARDRRRPGPPSQTWRTFLAHHVSPLASIDVFTGPTATVRVWVVVVALAPDRRRIVHVNGTAQPTAAWTAQLRREAWPCDTAPRVRLRDRDAVSGADRRRTAHALGLEAGGTAPRALCSIHSWRA